MVFNAVLNNISVISRRPVHLSILLGFFVFFFPSYLLFSHTTIVGIMDSCQRGMHPGAMTIINPRKEYWPSRGSNQRHENDRIWGGKKKRVEKMIIILPTRQLMSLEDNIDQDQTFSISAVWLQWILYSSVRIFLALVCLLFDLTLSKASPGQQYKSFENTVGKGEIAHNEQFLLFPLCFLTKWKNFCHFNLIWTVVCKLFEFGKSKICRLGQC